MHVTSEAEGVVRDPLAHYVAKPTDCDAWAHGIDPRDAGARARRIADYIAGMTTRCADRACEVFKADAGVAMKADGGSDRKVDLLIAGAGRPAWPKRSSHRSNARRAAVRKVRSGRRHRNDLGGNAPDSGEQSKPGRRFKRQRRTGRDYLTALIGALNPRELRAAYLRTGPRAIDDLSARSEVRFFPADRIRTPQNMAGAAVAGRDLVPNPSTAACWAPTLRASVRDPEIMVSATCGRQGGYPAPHPPFPSFATSFIRWIVCALPGGPAAPSARHRVMMATR